MNSDNVNAENNQPRKKRRAIEYRYLDTASTREDALKMLQEYGTFSIRDSGTLDDGYFKETFR